MEIGNHSSSHAYLLNRLPGEDAIAWRERVSADIRAAKEKFRSHLGSATRLFAYPFGEFSPELTDMVNKTGFVAAFGQQSGVLDCRSGFHPFVAIPDWWRPYLSGRISQ